MQIINLAEILNSIIIIIIYSTNKHINTLMFCNTNLDNLDLKKKLETRLI